MELRTFVLYAKTAAQSVYPYPCTLVDFDGNLTSGVAGSYLQFHDKATAATAGNVPIKSFYIPSAGPTPLASIFQALGPVEFKLGLSIGISSTAATYTAQTATFDIFGEIEASSQLTDDISGLSLITNAADNTLVFYTASATKRVFSLTITNGEGATVYPMLFSPQGLANNGNSPFRQLTPPIADGATRTYYFGLEGLTFPSIVTAQVTLSTTPIILTGSGALASTFSAKVKT